MGGLGLRVRSLGFQHWLECYMSHEKKKPLTFNETWLFHRDPYTSNRGPYNGSLKSPRNWVVSSSTYPKQPGFFIVHMVPSQLPGILF